jgi:AcrR family transcriptional regulator
VTTAKAFRGQPDDGPRRRADVDLSKFRQRLLDGLAESIAADGYAKTTVADIVRRARTSRRTFYEYFSSKEDCFIALHNETNAGIIRQIYAAVDRNAPWQTQVQQAVEAWITATESIPELVLSWIRDVPALGVASRRVQRDVMEAFIAMVQTLGDTEELLAAGVGPVSRERALMLLGGLRELTATTVEDGGQLRDVIDIAVEASIAMLVPRG